jgi:hypothetical protein
VLVDVAANNFGRQEGPVGSFRTAEKWRKQETDRRERVNSANRVQGGNRRVGLGVCCGGVVAMRCFGGVVYCDYLDPMSALATNNIPPLSS